MRETCRAPQLKFKYFKWIYKDRTIFAIVESKLGLRFNWSIIFGWLYFGLFLELFNCIFLHFVHNLFASNYYFYCFFAEAGLVLGCFVAIIAHFPSKPKNPPSVSSSMERMAFLPGLRSFLKNYKAIILTLAYRYENLKRRPFMFVS